MKDFNGKVLFLNRSDINTDEIIPAKYLTEIDRRALGAHCLEDLTLEGFDPSEDVQGKRCIVTQKNFGCGSSREHAPWALEENGINIVFAVSFARIFRQNMFNGGLAACEISAEDARQLTEKFCKKETSVTVDIKRKEAVFSDGDDKKTVSFELGPFEDALVHAGGWVEYADNKY